MIKKLLNKKYLSKFLCIFVVFIVLGSLLIVPAAAAETRAGIGELDAGYYQFKEDLSDVTPDVSSLSVEFYFFDGFSYTYAIEMQFQYRGYFVINFVTEYSTIEVYGSDGWTNDYYRTVFFPDVVTFPGGIFEYSWFFGLIVPLESLTPVSQGSYYMIYEILRNYIYGDQPLNSDMALTLTLISTIGALFVIVIPFVLVYFVIRLFRFI